MSVLEINGDVWTRRYDGNDKLPLPWEEFHKVLDTDRAVLLTNEGVEQPLRIPETHPVVEGLGWLMLGNA